MLNMLADQSLCRVLHKHRRSETIGFLYEIPLLDFINRNLLLLFGCQIVFVSGSVILVTIGGIAGYQLAPDPSLATLPVALMVVGTASATIPAALLMQRLGRRLGFVVGALLAASGAFTAGSALTAESFELFCVATTLVGSSLGFSQQFRFAAAESVEPHQVSFAVSFILLGSIVGAFVAPELVARSAETNPASPFVWAFDIAIYLYGIAIVLMLCLTLGKPDPTEHRAHDGTSLREIVTRRTVYTAVAAGFVGQGVMTYVMTATPISMNVGEGFSIIETSQVVRAHVIAMFAPSLVTPFLINRFGLRSIMALGVVTLTITLGVGLAGHHYMHYWGSMVLLGVGWNFLFVSGTTLLVQGYAPEERFRTQAFNDFTVFAGSALASLSAGTALSGLGWNGLLLAAFPALIVMALLVATFRPGLAKPV